MKGNQLGGSITLDLERLAGIVNVLLPVASIVFLCLGFKISPYFYFPAALFIYLLTVNFYYLHIQKHHTLLSNFGIVAQLRYVFESIGPEFRQYFFSNDQEERPFNRVERSDIYRKAKGVNSTSAFGSQMDYGKDEMKLRHSMFPTEKTDLKPFSLKIGEERGLKNTYELKNPFMISAMSYGALGKNAVRALARGAKYAGIAMNTGEGGFPKYHIQEGCDLIFQMGTAKFGTRNEDGSLNAEKLKEISNVPNVKMIEIKFSQGAKPGKGGMLPKEKISKEISELRGVPMGKDVISPARHVECTSSENTVKFIKNIQDISALPVGIKLCVGKVSEFESLIEEMKTQNIFPDYIAIDGAEGGTGAAPKTFMDDVGLSIHDSLEIVQNVLQQKNVRNKLKLIASGKLVSPGKQFMALAQGADAIYSARGFLLAIGCIQALQCNNNTCPVGITTHNKHLESGLNIEIKAQRVAQYIEGINHEHEELLCSLGKTSLSELSEEELYKA